MGDIIAPKMLITISFKFSSVEVTVSFLSSIRTIAFGVQYYKWTCLESDKYVSFVLRPWLKSSIIIAFIIGMALEYNTKSLPLEYKTFDDYIFDIFCIKPMLLEFSNIKSVLWNPRKGWLCMDYSATIYQTLLCHHVTNLVSLTQWCLLRFALF